LSPRRGEKAQWLTMAGQRASIRMEGVERKDAFPRPARGPDDETRTHLVSLDPERDALATPLWAIDVLAKFAGQIVHGGSEAFQRGSHFCVKLGPQLILNAAWLRPAIAWNGGGWWQVPQFSNQGGRLTAIAQWRFGQEF